MSDDNKYQYANKYRRRIALIYCASGIIQLPYYTTALMLKYDIS